MTSEHGESEAGREFDPIAPESGGKERTAERGPGAVTHGTPLPRHEYERLKERARRGGPDDPDDRPPPDGKP
ncbi:MAG TPA: hypothetical protein VGC93_19340 [Thermoanaerobaculia bacterium]